MGCGRIVTKQDIQQLRDARKGLQTGVTLLAGGNTGLGFKMMRNSGQKINKLVGDIGERATRHNIKGHDLNTTVGHNSKVYDVGNSKQIASVKTYGVGSGPISSQTIGNYLNSLRVATGKSQSHDNQKKINMAAQELRQAAQKGEAAFPSEIKNSTSDKGAREWLSKNAELRIPDDQVNAVRSAVHRSVLRSPTTYGLSANASYSEKAALANQLMYQVQPMGVSVTEIENLLDKNL